MGPPAALRLNNMWSNFFLVFFSARELMVRSVNPPCYILHPPEPGAFSVNEDYGRASLLFTESLLTALPPICVGRLGRDWRTACPRVPRWQFRIRFNSSVEEYLHARGTQWAFLVSTRLL